MKNYLKSFLLFVGLSISLSFLPVFVQAQPGDPCADSPCEPDAPIDGGVWVLLIFGAGYGVVKYYRSRNRQLAIEN